MKSKLLTVTFGLLLLTFFPSRMCSATVVTFDDLVRNTGTGSDINNGYQGLVWSNIGCLNAILSTNVLGLSGFYYGVLSRSNVAGVFGSNAFFPNSEIDSPATNLSFVSAYFTGAWRSNLNIRVEGFRSGSLIYDTTVVASATNPTLFTFNYLNIDRLYFDSYGGDVAFDHDGGNNFVMDDFTFEFIPEPSTVLLTGIGAVMLWAFRKRNRA